MITGNAVILTYRPADVVPKPAPPEPAYDPLDHRYRTMRPWMISQQAMDLARRLDCDPQEVIRRGLALLEAQHHRRH